MNVSDHLLAGKIPKIYTRAWANTRHSRYWHSNVTGVQRAERVGRHYWAWRQGHITHPRCLGRQRRNTGGVPLWAGRKKKNLTMEWNFACRLIRCSLYSWYKFNPLWLWPGYGQQLVRNHLTCQEIHWVYIPPPRPPFPSFSDANRQARWGFMGYWHAGPHYPSQRNTTQSCQDPEGLKLTNWDSPLTPQ